MASRCQARSFYPGLGVHANPGSRTALPLAFGSSDEVEQDDENPNSERKESLDLGDMREVTPEGANR